jgi:hypothetical protein
MRATYMLILVPLALSMPQPVAVLAQAKLVSVGNTVRLTLQGNPVPTEGTLSDVTSEEWRLSLQNGEYRSFDPTSVIAVEVWTTRRYALRGALIGAGAGLATALASARGDECRGDGTGEDICEVFETMAEWTAFVYVPLIGAGLGALVGAAIKTERWVPGLVAGAQQGTPMVELGWRVSAPW